MPEGRLSAPRSYGWNAGIGLVGDFFAYAASLEAYPGPMQWRWIAVAFCTVGVVACGKPAASNTAETAERACSPPRSHWLRPGPVDGVGVLINRLAINRYGAIYWNGEATELSRVSEYLSVVATMNPEPVTFLETEMGAPCALVERLRDEMERRQHCRNGGRCAEGIWMVWQHTPLPPGTPPS
jgi:hypothetical protein